MKKFRITKQIEGYEIGKVVSANRIAIPSEMLVELGLAEVVPFSVEELRKDLEENRKSGNIEMTPEEFIYFNALKIVVTCIEEFNGDWIATKDKNTVMNTKYFIVYDLGKDAFIIDDRNSWLLSPIPPCKDGYTAEKVIEICQPELNILFRVNEVV